MPIEKTCIPENVQTETQKGVLYIENRSKRGQYRILRSSLLLVLYKPCFESSDFRKAIDGERPKNVKSFCPRCCKHFDILILLKQQNVSIPSPTADIIYEQRIFLTYLKSKSATQSGNSQSCCYIHLQRALLSPPPFYHAASGSICYLQIYLRSCPPTI